MAPAPLLSGPQPSPQRRRDAEAASREARCQGSPSLLTAPALPAFPDFLQKAPQQLSRACLDWLKGEFAAEGNRLAWPSKAEANELVQRLVASFPDMKARAAVSLWQSQTAWLSASD